MKIAAAKPGYRKAAGAKSSVDLIFKMKNL